jgi:hypothetical protein
MSPLQVRPPDDLMTCGMDEFITALENLSAPECERHARSILDRIGGPSFEECVSRLLDTAWSSDNGKPPRTPDAYYFAIQELFPQVSQESDILGRFVALLMSMTTQRLGGRLHRKG